MAREGIDLSGLEEVDLDNLYRQETVTDLQSASIQILVPIKRDGTEDPGRQRKFVASTNLMTPGGALPLQTELEGATLEEAVKDLPRAVEKGVEDLMKRVQEAERERASGIVVPGQRPTSSLQLP